MNFLRMDDIDLTGKRVLIREDLNVPVREGVVANDTRIRAALPGIERALQAADRVIVMSHLGRPVEGVPVAEQEEYSLRPVADHLSGLLGREVTLLKDFRDAATLDGMSDQLLMLENVRTYKGEKGNAQALARDYASLCDVFVMDAFGTAHRAQASTHGVALHAKEACAGPLLAGELDALERSLSSPQRPMAAIVGGAKVSSKLEVLKNLSAKVDQLIVGGGIANTFLLAAGHAIGRSLCEPELVGVASELMQSVTIPLPSDVVVATELSTTAQARICDIAEVAADEMILDIGPDTAGRFAELLETMQTILWNGPVGVFEIEAFSAGTRRIAAAVADNRGFSIAGGGETIAAIDKFGVTEQISYISTGGGAFLEYVQGEPLPAVEVLKQRAVSA